jgi:hypothetical protein
MPRNEFLIKRRFEALSRVMGRLAAGGILRLSAMIFPKGLLDE